MKKLILFLSLFSVYAFGQADSNMVEIQGKATIADTDVFIVSGADTVYWKVTYAQFKTLMAAIHQPLEATLTDIADGTIAENLVNTANPWAENEIVSTMATESEVSTLINDSSLAGTTQSGMAMYQTSTPAWSEIAPGAVLDTLAKYATDVEVTSTGIISGGSRTPVTGSTTGFAAGFTGDNLYGGTYVVSSDDGDLQLPLMAAGMNFTIITLGAIQVVAASHADDGYLLDGVTADEDNSIVNTSTSGDIAVIQYYTADDWLITTNGWTAE